MQIPIPAFTHTMHAWQKEVIGEFDSFIKGISIKRFYIQNWHRRARKTTLWLNIIIKEAARNSGKVYLIITPTYSQGKKIYWDDPDMLFKWLPKELIRRKNEQELKVELVNGSIVRIVGADDPDAARGINCQGALFDEYATMKDATIWTEIIRPILALDNTRWAAFTFTPKGINHAFDLWDESEDWDDWFRSLLDGEISGLIPDEELEKMRREMPETLYNQEIKCSFNADEDNVLITQDMLDGLKGFVWQGKDTRKAIACDPSEGGDENVIYVGINGEIKEPTKILKGGGKKIDPAKTATEINVLANKWVIKDVGIDGIGVGSGVVSYCNDFGLRVENIQSGAKASDDKKFANRRAEMWWFAMEKVRDKEVYYPKCPILRRQIVSVTYKLQEGSRKIIIESKEKIRKLLGCSPDRADTWVYLIWMTFHVQDTTNYTEMREMAEEFERMAW